MSLPRLRNILPLCLPCLLLGGMLAACAGGSGGEGDEKPAEAPEVLYNRARDELADNSFKSAVENFEEVERQHPYSEWAKHAQIMAGYTNYRAGEFDKAVLILERFAKQHPGSASTPYAYYLIALCYYEQISDVGRDQKMTENALQALDEIIKRYPDSDYARDARLKLDLVYDHLAGKEMQVGRYYQNKLEYLAAINRFKLVVEKYQTTTHAPEALHRMVECYLALGIPEEAQKYAAVLGYNYPGSIWYQYSYAMVKDLPLPRDSGGKKGILNKLLNVF